MAEAEELLSDAARHATVFVQDLWRRHHKPPDRPATVGLAEVAPRLDLFLSALFNRSFMLRPAQLPARATLLSIVFAHHRKPRRVQCVPATDGRIVWLPPDSALADRELALHLYRAMALQQAARAQRGSAAAFKGLPPLQADLYLLLEAYAADRTLAQNLPGVAASIDRLRQYALAKRPPIAEFPAGRQPLERLVQNLLASSCSTDHAAIPCCDDPADSLAAIPQLLADAQLIPSGYPEHQLGPEPLLKDWWTGELRELIRADSTSPAGTCADGADDSPTPKSSRLARRPNVRQAQAGEDDQDEHQSPLMVQNDEPHQHAEDPMGMQRPTDRDDQTSADHFGDLVSELPEARLVSTPGRAKEVLLSDDPPEDVSKVLLETACSDAGLIYPEWDYRAQSYRPHGTRVQLLPCGLGSQTWVDATLAGYNALISDVRRRFEVLRAQRVWQRRQYDGDEIDLDAYIDSYTSFRAGNSWNEALYQSRRAAERRLAISLLIDTSGSTDSWVSAQRRIIDVEREALLLVCIALESLGEPYAVNAFSGEGPRAVTLREIKPFTTRYSNETALRISSLEPERYTRAGAALRHATAGLMRESAAHRLLLLLSDGKPNDQDEYEGVYGVEDMRQAVQEARMQGIHAFCLTVDRQAAGYLPRIFGPNQYALLPNPERLPVVLLDWMKRLLTS